MNELLNVVIVGMSDLGADGETLVITRPLWECTQADVAAIVRNVAVELCNKCGNGKLSITVDTIDS